MRILVIGSSGMLGHMITSYLEELSYEITDISCTKKLRDKTILLDVLNTDKIESFFGNNKFDIIINCAALLVKQSEHNKKNAISLNSWFPHYLEEKFKNTSTKIIQISTDAVFSHSNKCFYSYNICNPDTFYGQSKLLGELKNEKDLTIRSAFWGPDINESGGGLMNWFLQQKHDVKGFAFVKFNGITSLECAKFIEKAIIYNYTGVYNLGASDVISKYELLSYISQMFNVQIHINSINEPIYIRILKDERINEEKSFKELLYELQGWMIEHKELYPHYERIGVL